MSAYSKRTQALVAALLLALGFAIGFASMQQAYADEGDDAPNTPIKAAGIDLSSLSQGLYTVAGFQVDDKEDHDGAINVDPTDGPAYIYVDASGNATLLVRMYNPNKYDYIWKGKVADRPSSNATDQMIPGTPLFADANYIANGMHKGNIFNDTTGVYGILGASYKAMYFEIPVTSDEISSGKVYFCIRCTPGLTDEGGQWMDSNDHYFLIQACEPVAGVDTSTWQLKPANIKEAITLANAIPQVPDASDLATYVPAREAYIALDYSATQDYGRAFLDAVIPEVKAKLDATDAAIPDIVPADGTYVFTQTLPGSVYPSTAVPFVSDSLWSTVMTVENGKMTLQIVQRRGSYGYVYAGLPSEALAAQTAAGDSGRDASHTPGASNFKNVVSVYLDNPLSVSNPVDGTITFDGPGVYPMYAGTIEIPSLEKPVALSFLGTSWYNRSFVFTQENMFTEGAVNCIRLINKLVNSPEPESASSEVTPYKVDAALLSNADEAITKAAVDAYLALNDTDRTTIDSRVILSTPEGAADAQTYFQALGVAVEKFGISLEEAIQVDVPVAATDLVYNGEEQIGVAASKGYTVESGSAVEAGDYVATASLLPGYVWADGTFGDKLVAWSIASAPDIPTINIETDEFSFCAYNDYLGSNVVAGFDGEVDLIEALNLSLYYWGDDDDPINLEYGTDYQVSQWYCWDYGQDDYVEIDSYPTDIGDYKVMVEGIGSYTGVRFTRFQVYDAYNIGSFWHLDLDSWIVEYADGALVCPDFRVYYYDADGDEVDVDANEYDVKVMHDPYDDGVEKYEEVADGAMEPGYYFLQITPAEGSPYYGCVKYGFEVVAPSDIGRIWNLELDSSVVEYASGSIVYPDFRVYAYDDDDDEIDVDAGEYDVKVLRETYDDDAEEYVYEEVADGDFEPGYYWLRVVPAEGSPYHGYVQEEYRVVDLYDVGRLWNLEIYSYNVEYAGGALVYPDFSVYAYGDDYDAVDVDENEYAVKVMRTEHDEEMDEWMPLDEEVADGKMEPGYYCLRIVPAEGSPYHGYLQDDEEGLFRVRDSGSVSEASIWLDEYTYFVGALPKGFGPTVSMYDEDEEESVLLKEGGDYTLGVQKDYSADGDESDWRDFKGFDGTVAGLYRFVITGKGSYHGEAYSYSFLIADRNDIGYAEVEILNDLLVKSGSKATPELEVTLHGTVLAEGADYSLTYYEIEWSSEHESDEYVRVGKVVPPLGIGDYEAEIKAAGAYSGIKSYYFSVDDKNDLQMGTFELNRTAYTYTGEPIELDYTLKASDGTELVLGKDYRLLYGVWDDLAGEDDSGAIVGEVSETPPTEMIDSYFDECYAVYAEGIGEYCGMSSTCLFDIVEPGDIEAAVFKFSNSAVARTHEVAYTGRAAALKFTLVMPGKNGDTTLVEGRDYTVKYREYSDYEYVDAPTAVGQYAIIVEGIGYEGEDGYEAGYFGYKYFNFNIGKSLANAKVAVADQDYTGKKLKPAVTVVLDGKIVPADCYQVEYASNVGPGTATVTVTALEYDDDYNYAGVIGTGTGTFEIVDRAADKAAADAVIAKINAIGEVTANSGNAIAAARAAYNALTADQKALVSAAQLAKLTSAESAYKKAVADAEVAEAAAKLTAASTINAATVKAADIKKASSLGATTVTLGPKVKKIAKNAFKGTKITTVVVKSKKLTKKSVKNAFKGSKVKTVKVPKSKKKAYKKIFTKKVVDKKVKVK